MKPNLDPNPNDQINKLSPLEMKVGPISKDRIEPHNAAYIVLQGRICDF